MRPTKAPDNDYGMPAEYGMYGDYEEYDEDDFFYHMYFDEVSTTPLPEEFYQILEAVSDGANAQNSSPDYPEYPDYFDYLLNTKGIVPSDSDSKNETDVSVGDENIRKSKNNRYLQLKVGDITTKSSNKLRRNSKFRRLKHRKNSRGGAEKPAHVSSRRNSKVMKFSEHFNNENVKSSKVTQRQNSKVTRSKRAASKNARTSKPKKWNKNKWIRLRDRKRKKLERSRLSAHPRIIGILDRRVPALFRQNPFVTISLAKFVVLSTGVTTAAAVTTAGDISNILPPVVVVKPSVVVPTVSVPTSSWTPDKWGTWPFITISGVSASNITYLLVSLFILYVGIILYVDGDYLYNKVKEFAITRLSNVRRNVIKRVHTESGLNYLTDTLTSAWDAMKANFGVSPLATAPHGWIAPYRSGDGGAGAYHRRKNHHQRPYRKRRRKFFRKNPNSESDIYSSSNYRRTVPRQSTYSWGAEPGKSKNYWYNGDYQEDFEESHDYYQPSLEKTYRDHYRYSENYQSSRREENLEEEEEYYYDDYEYTR